MELSNFCLLKGAEFKLLHTCLVVGWVAGLMEIITNSATKVEPWLSLAIKPLTFFRAMEKEMGKKIDDYQHEN